jgi:hypothetical protein
MTLKGTLRKVDLGAGGWVLEAGGKRVQLVGDVPAGLDGKRVEVEGRKVEALGFLMTGDGTFEVSAVKAS